MPKISFARLAELVPDAFQVGIHSGVQLRVPAARLALSYQLVESRELVEEPVEDLPVPPPVEETFALLDTLPPPSGEKFAPVIDDLPPLPGAKDLPRDTVSEESSFKPKLPPIAPPAALVAKEEPIATPAPKPPLPEIPIPEPPVAPAVAELAPVPAPKPPLPEIPAPAAISPIPAAAEEKTPPVEAKSGPPVPPVVEPQKPLPKIVPVVTPASIPPVQETTPPPAPAAPAPAAAAPEPTAPPATGSVPPSPEQVAPPAPIARRPFSLLPIFRRKVVEPPKPIVAPEPRARVEIPKPKKPLAPLTSINVPPAEPPVAPPPPKPAKPEIPALAILKEEASEPKAAIPEPKVAPEVKIAPESKLPEAIPVPPPTVLKEEVPPPPGVSAALVPPSTPEKTEAVFVETEHFPQGGKDVPAELPEQDSLQALFLTEDVLSVDRVIELCNGLPGIKSCILTRSGAVVNARNVPDSIDLISLSANALEMFRALRGSCAKMGIGAVPAVTMHSQKGPITFFHEEDICLLVLHKDRGFVPGVREKLQMVVEELSKANLLLPVSGRGTKELK